MVPEVVTDAGISRPIADAVVSEARRGGINNGLVYVASIYNPAVPLAVRTLDEGGWGMHTDEFVNIQRERLEKARGSTQYAINAMRSGGEQRDYERSKGRTRASYGDFDPDTVGRSVYLGDKGIIVTFVGGRIDAARSEDMVKQAVLNRGDVLDSSGDSLLDVLVSSLGKKLPREATGVALIGLCEFFDNCGSMDPLLLSLQILGPLNTGTYGVVASKARAAINTGHPSGPRLFTGWQELSQIEGGVQIKVDGLVGKKRRVLAVGGLRPGQADLDLIQEVIASNLTLGISILGLT